MCLLSNPHLSFAAGFGTLTNQVAGLHRAVPSTTLDKAYMQFSDIFYSIFQKSQGLFLIFFVLFVHNSSIDFCGRKWYHIYNTF